MILKGGILSIFPKKSSMVMQKSTHFLMLLQTVYLSSQNDEIYSVLPTNIAYFYIFCANCQNTREIRLKMMLNSIFTIVINSFVGLFIAILKEQQGVIYKGTFVKYVVFHTPQGVGRGVLSSTFFNFFDKKILCSKSIRNVIPDKKFFKFFI